MNSKINSPMRILLGRRILRVHEVRDVALSHVGPKRHIDFLENFSFTVINIFHKYIELLFNHHC